mmetsp:Transcript_42901/g.107217  ORF Transcript_42901/g.107217 Transcript_42901/m.107217 type:complete len:90 (+) Transcript_42901:2157-2426(+)
MPESANQHVTLERKTQTDRQISLPTGMHAQTQRRQDRRASENDTYSLRSAGDPKTARHTHQLTNAIQNLSALLLDVCLSVCLGLLAGHQ